MTVTATALVVSHLCFLQPAVAALPTGLYWLDQQVLKRVLQVSKNMRLNTSKLCCYADVELARLSTLKSPSEDAAEPLCDECAVDATHAVNLTCPSLMQHAVLATSTVCSWQDNVRPSLGFQQLQSIVLQLQGQRCIHVLDEMQTGPTQGTDTHRTHKLAETYKYSHTHIHTCTVRTQQTGSVVVMLARWHSVHCA